MERTSLRASKFFVIFYGDAISEKEYYAKNFFVSSENETCLFEFELMTGLDFENFEIYRGDFDACILEDSFLKNKIVSVLKKNTELRFFKLKINGVHDFQSRIIKIKFKENAVIFTF